MNFNSKIFEIQKALEEGELEGWLIYDYRRSNSIAHNFLQISSEKMTTRRFFYWIPKKGDPIKILPQIEPYTLDHLPGKKWIYRGWKELENLLHSLPIGKIAMEYSPQNALPNISKVDAGMVEWIENGGVKIVSSANLLQKFTNVWDSDQVKSHFYAAHVLEKIVDQTWAMIESRLKNKSSLNEYQVQQFMLNLMEKEGCCTADHPTCAVNQNSADPHYHPTLHHSLPIKKGDFILLDLWCKQKISKAVYADITRVGVADSSTTFKQREIFNIVKQSRDDALLFIQKNYSQNTPIYGWQVDQVARDRIEHEGYGNFFIHRTGHNIGEDVHGTGANLDNLETHDDRELITGTGFSVEPGIYLPGEFGVRLENDVYLASEGKVNITGGLQEELKVLNSLQGD